MAKIDLEGMSLDELWELHERISKTLSARIVAEKEELEKRLEQLSAGRDREGGVLVALNSRSSRNSRPRRKYPQVFPKYKNPDDPNETWSGRGKQPRWLVAALKAGGKVDDYRIPDDESARPRLTGARS
jgi:DNA-binding protein H-NS